MTDPLPPLAAPDEADSRSTAPPRSTARILLGAGVGNMLEWFDWSVYAIFATFFATQFFVDDGALGAVLSTLAIFAVGFLMRPLGGFLFGWVADRRGRRFAMTTSMMMMAGGSLLIGVSPTHGQIGIWAAVLLVVARLVQGLAHGGEISASYTYIAEIAPRHRRGLWSTTVYVSVTAGILSASLIGALASTIFGAEDLRQWAWRIPFLIGGALGLVGLYLRRSLHETTAFQEAEPAPRTLRSLAADLGRNRVNLARTIGLTAGITVIYYVWAVGISGFAISTRGVDPTHALWATVVANTLFMITLPLWGLLSDRVGRRPVYLAYGIAMALVAYPLLALLDDSAVRLGVLMTVALVLMGAFVGNMPAYFSELFPTRVRASGVGIGSSLTVAILGGSAPYLLTWLSAQGLEWVFGLYTVVLALIGLVTAAFSPETKGSDLQ
ncbi:MFS transporter [Pseudonocardia sp. NPDC049154]|uniref:MFS transporter n=1 Tax=Pseudonocardia sp. NPDC049154 TaxID=3155501 RepID=UPI0033D81955